MKYKTILEGEQAVVYNHLGEGRLLIGPQRVFLFRERLVKLTLFTANLYQYLAVKYETGLVKHIAGPCELFENPMEHVYVHVKDAIKIDANHMVVVYKQDTNNAVQRRIVQGPVVFFPEAEEWLHEFKWHGEDINQNGRMIPARKQFTKLTTIADQFYYNVSEVRTNDDTMMQVKLMIFYELKDVLTMLQATHDPIADMINAVCADVIAVAGKLSFQEFLGKTNVMSEMSTYSQLSQRAARVGYHVSKVVYRGYHASDQLQMMQDRAIQARTQLRLDAEIQEQKQSLIDFKLAKEQERCQMNQELENTKVHHRQKMERMKQAHAAQLQQLAQTVDLECQSMQDEAKMEIDALQSEHSVTHLQALKDLDIDLTQLLVNKGKVQIDQEYQVVTAQTV